MNSAARKVDVRFDEKQIDAIFRDLDQGHLPGAAIGIAVGGRCVYRKGFGLANIELPLILSPTIRLRAGSVSKQFTCFAYMLLCEDGKAGLDDPVGKHLPELHAVSRQATMRQLMGHTSGIRDVYAIFDRFNDDYTGGSGAAQSVSSAELLRCYEDIDDVDAAPGTTWIYNNGGYLLLSIAIERIAGQSLEDAMRQRVFEPIGMYDSLLLRSDMTFIPNRASQHVVNPTGGYERLNWGMDGYLGAGAVVSTVDDLLLWLAHMDEPKVGSATTWAAMKNAQTLANGVSTGYGLGLQIDTYCGLKTVSHAGNALGGNAQTLSVPAAGLHIAIMVNRQDVWGSALSQKILAACLPGLAPKTQTAPRPWSWGTFRSPTSGQVIELYDGTFRAFSPQAQQIVSINGMDLPFEADSEGVLWLKWASEEERQSVHLIGDPARPSAIRFGYFGEADDLIRVPSVARPGSRAPIGRYRSEAIRTVAMICEFDNEIRLTATGRFGSVAYRLECLSEGIWRAKTVGASRVGFIGGMLTFDQDERAFRFASYQMRSLTFRRCD